MRVLKALDSTQYVVAFSEPTVAQEDAQCDRCHGHRHRKTNALCTASSAGAAVKSPFTKPSGLYCIETGQQSGTIHFTEMSLKKRATTGTGVATVLLFDRIDL